MGVRPALAALLLTLALAPAAHGPSYRPGGETPGACRGAKFVDVVGTLAPDALRPGPLPLAQRVYGLTGADWLTGAASVPSCLFGGQGDDVLALGAAGGVALGEDGRDTLVGGPGPDALSGGDGGDRLFGLGGIDVLRGGRAVDQFAGGEGDDILDAADGRRELLDCGPGEDTVQGDGFDAVLGCERGKLAGRGLPGRKAQRGRVQFVAPYPGEYRIVAECGEIGRVGGLRRGDRGAIRVRGACASAGYLVHAPAADQPLEPLLRVTKLAP